ncbi:protein KTI12 homolog isoform X2 [Xenia sp. Carnegie-2017]|uniref:protein KTI12 homolog isoform X2 n=1 Tax=Xenia sp. Carnegie-2017 TaxID=2897299 RepID=UPI001F03B70E|nr:protein KTI12 homolog isoform X2 [Xenia sp. Carnegie-2017]
MPFIMMCGFPASGKTTRCHDLEKYFSLKRGRVVKVVNDDLLELDKNLVYSSSSNEKSARCSLKSAVERFMSRDVVVILDSLNYIKGYRYELYCSAKAHKTPHCVVYCESSKEKCVEWNKQRENKYEDKLMDELMMRFEPPDSKNRWDSPLFTVQVKDVLPMDAIYDAVINRIPPPPNQATECQPLSATSFLSDLDKKTQDVINKILTAQKTNLPGEVIIIPGASNKMHPVEDTNKVTNMFIDYLNSTVT